MNKVDDYLKQRLMVSRYFKNVGPMMAQVLRGSAAFPINVRFHGAHINSVSLHKVMHVVESGQVLVVHDPTLNPGTAKTIHKYDVVMVQFDVASSLYYKSALIHEAVHVRTDMRGKAAATIYDEMLAWIVQAVYLRFGGLRASNYPGAIDRRTLPAALSIADTLLTGNRVNAFQEATLRSAILAMPAYSEIGGQFLHSDGVRPIKR
ncbi:hypothetical protein [Variovorax sp. dw_954]|uniref:hypothetical protein n=1 Tax=Variovorax sp. dw_954 TaxID=2720078 RepID=UPI001BD58011|nr:hypothetical protein [Variovorax sp. dw_954]